MVNSLLLFFLEGALQYCTNFRLNTGLLDVIHQVAVEQVHITGENYIQYKPFNSNKSKLAKIS